MPDVFEHTVVVARVTRAEPFPETRKPEMVRLWLDTGERELQSAAQLGFNHDPDTLAGRQVLCVTNLEPVNIAGFESEALTVGVPDADGNPVLVVPDAEVPLGGHLY